MEAGKTENPEIVSPANSGDNSAEVENKGNKDNKEGSEEKEGKEDGGAREHLETEDVTVTEQPAAAEKAQTESGRKRRIIPSLVKPNAEVAPATPGAKEEREEKGSAFSVCKEKNRSQPCEKSDDTGNPEEEQECPTAEQGVAETISRKLDTSFATVRGEGKGGND